VIAEPGLSIVIATSAPKRDGRSFGVAILPHDENALVDWDAKAGNAAFIAAARNALPELIKEVRRLRAELDAWYLDEAA